MVVLKRINKQNINEAKQVGDLYHVTNLEDIANYIAPKDTLSASGNYKNWLLNGRSDCVSFTRNKGFVVKTQKIQDSLVIFNFQVDGDLLSEKYKVRPYNDFAYDEEGNAEYEYALNYPKDLESEEVVLGSIKKFSKYVKSVRFNAIISNFSIIHHIRYYLEKCVDYLNQFTITFDPKLIVKESLNDILYPKITFPSFSDFVNFIYTLDDLHIGKDVNKEDIKKYIGFLSLDALNNLLHTLTDSFKHPNSTLIEVLLNAGADPKEINFDHLPCDDLLKFGKHLSDKDKIKYVTPLVTLDMLNLDPELFHSPISPVFTTRRVEAHGL